MEYQLVIQTRILSIDDLIKLEDLITENLGGGSEVDGHDLGQGEANIFVLTSEPEKEFEKILPILEAEQIDAKVAYRRLGQHAFTILWPLHLKDFKIA